MKNGDKIVHMVPAAGYYAAYQNGDEVTYKPVATWIVLEDQQGRQRVDGVDPRGTSWDGRRVATRKISSSSLTGRSGNIAGDTMLDPSPESITPASSTLPNVTAQRRAPRSAVDGQMSRVWL
jgi:hypothetical protein